ncbi:prepilin-type N-terminal cleavage/methylation domain-containing protein [Virgibacillus kekensis]|uniref:Prepilin-type N-terminal cleavage/methylation domain-containing protein n=1 Tax=Virgibacillus kekensis TaxID=202261 RepID=A0ABV9DJ15_9BACI
MKSNKGFSLIESLVAVSMLCMMIVTLIPLTSLIMTERDILHEKRLYSNILHDKFQDYIWNTGEPLPSRVEEEIAGKKLVFTFTIENKLLKGCVVWTNAKKMSEETCFYGRTVK